MFSNSILFRALVAAGARAASNFSTVRQQQSFTTTATDDNNNNSSTNSNNNTSSDYASSSQQFSSSNQDNNNNDSSSNNQPQDENQAAIQASATQLMRFRIPKPEQFYFSGGDNICRLCNEFVPNTNIRFHLVGAGPRGPSTHMGREIVLDSLVFYGKLGFDPAMVMRSWAFTLLSHPQFVRLPELLPPDPTDLHARARKTHELLQSLKRLKVIDVSVSPHSDVTKTEWGMRMAVKRRVAFERLECIGDNAWGSNLSGRMLLVFPDKRWAHCQMHHSFNVFRDLAETNTNLERMFDLIDITELLPPASRAIVGDGKIKADIFEAILGELNCALYAHEANLWGTSEEYTELNDEHLARVCIIIKHVLNEIFDLTLLCLMYLLGEHAIPIARELSMGTMMNLNVAPSKPALDVGDSIRTRRPHYHKNYVPTFTLPPSPRVTQERDSESRKGNLKREFKRFGPVINMTSRSQYKPMWSHFFEQDRKLKMNDPRFAEVVNNNNSGKEEEGEKSSASSSSSSSSLMRLMKKPTTATKEKEASLDINFSSSISCQPPLESVEARMQRRKEEGGDFSSLNKNNNGTSIDDDNRSPEQIISDSLESASLPFGIFTQKSMPSSNTTTSSSNNNNNYNSNDFYRSLCPFPKLSKYPPHIYNPYGLSDDEWMARWMKEEDAKEFFDDEVCDNIGTVMAQFEATAAFGTTATSNNKKTKTTQKQLLTLSKEGKYNAMIDQVFEKLEEQEGENDYEDEEATTTTFDTTTAKNISCIRDEVLHYIHPFRYGVTVGTDGAAFGSLSGSISEVNNKVDMKQTDSSWGEDAEENRDSYVKLDLDEIKRRNALKTGESYGSGGNNNRRGGGGGGGRRY